MTAHQSDQHTPAGLRRIEVALPPSLVVELDAAMTHRRINVSRSRVVAMAIRRFLDQDGMEMFPIYPHWP